jgi:hypothetical protein
VAWIVYITALDGVIVDIFQLFQQHFLILQKLRVRAFLPYLMFTVCLVAFLVKSELFEYPVDNRAGQEMRATDFINAVSASAHEFVPRYSSFFDDFSRSHAPALRLGSGQAWESLSGRSSAE